MFVEHRPDVTPPKPDDHPVPPEANAKIKDPVCGMAVTSESSHHLQHEGTPVNLPHPPVSATSSGTAPPGRAAYPHLLAPLDLGWKARAQAELALMADLQPLLTQRAGGRDISGLSAYA